MLKDVWRSTWEFQATARSLRPILDFLPMEPERIQEVLQKRGEIHNASVKDFIETVVKNKPFIPQEIYDNCLSLREVVVDLQMEFRKSIDRPSASLDWELIRESGRHLDERLEALSNAIRRYVHGKAEQFD